MKLTKEDLTSSAIREILNLGGANAATSLGKLINKTIKMNVPTVELMEYVEVYEEIISEDREVKVVIMNLLANEGTFLFVIQPENASELAREMYGKDTTLDDELIDSAMKELENILVNSFLNAVMKVLDLNLITSVPQLRQDYFGAILSSIYLEKGIFDSTIFILNNEFWSENEKIDSSLFFIPSPELMDTIISKIDLN